ncbi:MAG: hypothetical protein WC269_01465 [Candidatus Gracilibacteria bacterium]|jgi:hypothetical protein
MLKSASKVVLLILSVTLCVGFILGTLDGDKFMIALMAVYGFYFANKGDSSQPYLGK